MMHSTTGRLSLLALLGAAFSLAWAMPEAPVRADASTAPLAAADTAVQISLEFEKTSVDEGIWEGRVTGDVEGGLRTELQELEEEGPIWNVRFLWIIDAGGESFTADLSGTLNTETGVAEMAGEVTEAADDSLVGARVRERGQLVAQDAETGATTFQGTIQVKP